MQSIIQKLLGFFGLSKSWQIFLIIGIIALHFYLVFPSRLYLDSHSMFQDAINLRYVDYWSPLTLLFLHGLNYILEGGELMLFINLTTLWGACLIGLYLFRGEKIAFWFLVIPFIPLFLYFWGIGIKYLLQDKDALILFMLSSMGLSLIFVLFVCCLAAAGRYIYFSWCCFAFSVPFAHRICYKYREALSNNGKSVKA